MFFSIKPPQVKLLVGERQATEVCIITLVHLGNEVNKSAERHRFLINRQRTLLTAIKHEASTSLKSAAMCAARSDAQTANSLFFLVGGCPVWTQQEWPFWWGVCPVLVGECRRCWAFGLRKPRRFRGCPLTLARTPAECRSVLRVGWLLLAPGFWPLSQIRIFVLAAWVLAANPNPMHLARPAAIKPWAGRWYVQGIQHVDAQDSPNSIALPR